MPWISTTMSNTLGSTSVLENFKVDSPEVYVPRRLSALDVTSSAPGASLGPALEHAAKSALIATKIMECFMIYLLSPRINRRTNSIHRQSIFPATREVL